MSSSSSPEKFCGYTKLLPMVSSVHVASSVHALHVNTFVVLISIQGHAISYDEVEKMT